MNSLEYYGSLKPFLPDLLLVTVGMGIFLLNLILGEGDRRAWTLIGSATLLGVIGLSVSALAAPLIPCYLFEGLLILDRFTIYSRVLWGVLALIIILTGRRGGTRHGGEFTALLLILVFALDLLSAAVNMVSVALAMEITFLVSFALAGGIGHLRDHWLKAMVLGGLGSALTLYGFSWLYGAGLALDLPRVAETLAANRSLPLMVWALGLLAVGLVLKMSTQPFAPVKGGDRRAATAIHLLRMTLSAGWLALALRLFFLLPGQIYLDAGLAMNSLFWPGLLLAGALISLLFSRMSPST